MEDVHLHTDVYISYTLHIYIRYICIYVYCKLMYNCFHPSFLFFFIYSFPIKQCMASSLFSRIMVVKLGCYLCLFSCLSCCLSSNEY